MKIYAVDIEADDYSVLDEFTLCRKQIKKKHIKNVVIVFAERHEQTYSIIYGILIILAFFGYNYNWWKIIINSRALETQSGEYD